MNKIILTVLYRILFLVIDSAQTNSSVGREEESKQT